MSLIQEALRRQQEEYGEDASKTNPPAQPSAQNLTPAQPSVSENQTQPKKDSTSIVSEALKKESGGAQNFPPKPDRSCLGLLGVILAIILILGLAALLAFLAWKHFSESQIVPKSTPAARESAAEALPELSAEDSAITAVKLVAEEAGQIENQSGSLETTTEDVVPDVAAEQAMPTPEKTEPEADAVKLTVNTSESETEAATELPESPPIPEEPQPEPEAAPSILSLTVEKKSDMPKKTSAAQSAQAVSWPTLKLTGILYRSNPDEGAVYINGRLLTRGNVIEGVTVIRIQPNGVFLSYQGEERFLRAGSVLY